jgi:protein involved in polysaccharide export with SLBB domain
MNRWSVLLVCAATGVAALFSGCQSTGPKFDPLAKVEASFLMNDVTLSNQVNLEWLQAPTNLFTLGPGDRLQVEVMGDPATRTTALVGPDGRMYFYLLPGLDVWGLTLAQARERVERELLNFIRDNPKAMLTLREVQSQRIWMLGRLNSPGVYPMTAPMTLLEAVSRAGGPANIGAGASLGGGSVTVNLSAATEEAADLRRSFVMRQGRLLPLDFHRLIKEGDLTQNIYLQPDDFVYLPSAVSRNVYVLGAVAQPKAVPFVDQVTLISAVAGAGGTIKDAYLSHVAVVRGSLTQPQIAILDYRDIVRGKAPDVLLHPQDIVYVPFSPYRTLTRYADLILETFVRTVGANEGARAAVPGSAPVGVNVPLGGTLGGSLPR